MSAEELERAQAESRERALRAVLEEDVRAQLRVLSADVLLKVCTDLALCSEDMMNKAKTLASHYLNLDPSARKIFVRNLSFHVSQEECKSFFEKYGPVEDVCILTDRMTGRPKGYGFVIFAHAEAAMLALKHPEKEFCGRTIHCHVSTTGSSRDNFRNKRPRYSNEYISV